VLHEVLAESNLLVRIPDGDVGVGADHDRTLTRIKPIHLGVIGRCQRDELRKGNGPLDTPLENRIGSRAATPGMPLGTQRNEVRALHMHDHDRNADQFGMRDCAVRGLAFDEFGA
jgi:hypothetical protein